MTTTVQIWIAITVGVIIAVTRDNTDVTMSTVSTSIASFVVIGGTQKVKGELDSLKMI